MPFAETQIHFIKQKFDTMRHVSSYHQYMHLTGWRNLNNDY